MPPRLAWIVIASLALPSVAFAQGSDASRIIFAKDAGGHVTHYIYRELGPTDRIVRKIK
jgi:hypothetical protein